MDTRDEKKFFPKSFLNNDEMSLTLPDERRIFHRKFASKKKKRIKTNLRSSTIIDCWRVTCHLFQRKKNNNKEEELKMANPPRDKIGSKRIENIIELYLMNHR